jgi:beta-glucosidase
MGWSRHERLVGPPQLVDEAESDVDRFRTYSTTGAIQAGLDLEMPGPSRWRGEALTHAAVANKVKHSQLNARARNVLNLVNFAQGSGVPENAAEREMNIEEHRSLLRQVAAQSIVLLKNKSILPLKKTKVAVIGPNSKIATYCGGGSASLNPYYNVTPFEGVAAKAEVQFSQGIYGHQSLPQLGPRLQTLDGREGFEWRVYNEPPHETRRVLETRILTDANVFFLDYSHPELAPVWFSDAEGVFVPEESGTYDFGLTVQGTARLYINGNLLVSNVENQKRGSSFLGSGTVEEMGTTDLVAATEYRILVQWGCAKTSKLKVPGVVDFGHGGFRFSACRRMDQAMEHAVQVAASAEQVVLFAGLIGEWECEGQDRKKMDLPPHTDELISRVLEVCPNAVIVIQSGTPVAMPWIEKANAVVQAWYRGNETGNVIADMLFGDVNPVGQMDVAGNQANIASSPASFLLRSLAD